MLVDFDWSGKVDEARYSLLNPGISAWHQDAVAFGLIKKEHDLHMLGQL